MACHRNIWELSADERVRLHAAIKEYIAMPGVVGWHTRHHELHTSGYFFLAGHREYLAGLESFLKTRGLLGAGEFLPMWDPSDRQPARRRIPPEFIDPATGPDRIHEIWAPLRPFVAFMFFPFRGFWLKLWPPFPFPHPQFVPWTSLYGIVLAWTAHFAVHVLVGGVFADIPRTSQTPLFWLWHACVDEYYCGWLEAHGHAAHGAPDTHDDGHDDGHGDGHDHDHGHVHTHPS